MTLTPFEISAKKINYQYRHPKILHGLIRWLEPQVCVEVGCHIGMSSVWMGRALQENNNGRLFCVDPWCWPEPQEELWEKNLTDCGVRDWVTLVRGRSQEVTWPERVDFAFIDGNHTYEVCKWDVTRARELGATCIAIHDTVSWEGSRRYAEEIRDHSDWRSWDFMESELDCGILICKRRMPKGPCEGMDVGEKWDKPTGGR